MIKIIQGNCLNVLSTLDSQSIQCCITSPPFYGLRDYQMDDQLGLEETPEEFVTNLVDVFREVRRVLRDDGTLWLNLGDSYARSNSKLKPKDLVGIPWRVAFALQADGWYLRQDIIWHKPNPMPESVTDRCTKSHEYIFLLTKSKRYYYDHEAIKESCISENRSREKNNGESAVDTKKRGSGGCCGVSSSTRNKRSVWTVTTMSYKGAHFAVFPEKLIEPCVLAGCPSSSTILDPFAGSGTTGLVAKRLGCGFVGVELNQEYVEMARNRLENQQDSLFRGTYRR